jgi:hypothetical protein
MIGIARTRFCLWGWAGVTPRTSGRRTDIGRVSWLGARPVQDPSTASRLRRRTGAAEPTLKPRLIVHLEAAIADLELGSVFTRDNARSLNARVLLGARSTNLAPATHERTLTRRVRNALCYRVPRSTATRS